MDQNETTTTKRGRPAKAAPGLAVAPQPQPTARIVKMLPRESSKVQRAIARKLGGTYRVIHGRMAVPRPHEEWHYPDGTANPNELPFAYAMPGDEIAFGDLEAAQLLDANLIEPLDAKPSMVGKGWKPPIAMRVQNFGPEDEESYARGQLHGEYGEGATG